jgi:ABC-type polysaccharide/polyol phosphate export permease
MLFLLYCLPLLFYFWQRNCSCRCYIVYHYCLRFDRGVVHVVFAIFSTITGTVLGLREEWFVSLLYCLPLLFKVWQRSGSCCCYIVYYYCLRFDRVVVLVVVLILSCYIVYHYCLRFDRGVVHVLVILSTITVEGLTEKWFMLLMLYCLPLFFKVWQRSGSCCCCYIVYNYCFRFDRAVVHDVILSTITV